MKRILLACFLLTASCSVSFTQRAAAQITTPRVTLATFTAKVNLMDSYIGSGNMTAAQSTWNEINTMMMSVLHVSKESIHNATTDADRNAHITIMQNQQNIYSVIWGLKPDLATNRAALHTKLGEYGATIY